MNRTLISLCVSVPAALATPPLVLSQAQMPQGFLLDAVTFRGADNSAPRTDVYVSVPYELLQFTEYNGTHVAEYSLTVTIRDSSSRRLYDSTYRRTVTEDDYAVTRGKTGKSDNSVRKHLLRPGTYRVEVVLRDVFSKREHTVTRKVVVRAMDRRDTHGMSSVMLASDVEQRGSRFSIVPYIGDVIWSADVGLFAFVETYDAKPPIQRALSWNIRAADGRELAGGIGEPFTNETGAKQTFVPLTVPTRIIPGTYTLNVRLHPVGPNDVVDTTTVLCERSRPYVVPRSTAGAVLSDLSKAIRQLIYIADQQDIDGINGASTEPDKLSRFEEFWKKVDPTPSSVRNEAFEDYYGRIEQATKRFQSYTEGWLTDMGRVYVIFGEPQNIDRFTAQNGVSVVVRWTYANGQVFTFDDANGFGDYRLRSPLPPGSKYRYR